MGAARGVCRESEAACGPAAGGNRICRAVIGGGGSINWIRGSVNMASVAPPGG